MKCAYCGTMAVFDEEKHCLNCGAPMIEEKQSPKSGDVPFRETMQFFMTLNELREMQGLELLPSPWGDAPIAM